MNSSQTPAPLVQPDPSRNLVALQVDTEVYSKEAVFGAAYIFIDRCYVLLDAPAANRISVTLRGKDALSEEGLDALAGEFFNELIAQTLRDMVCAQNSSLLTTVVGRVMSAAAGPAPALDVASLDELELDDEPFDDPLGIAVSWEEKYGKKRAPKSSASKPGPADTGSSEA